MSNPTRTFDQTTEVQLEIVTDFIAAAHSLDRCPVPALHNALSFLVSAIIRLDDRADEQHYLHTLVNNSIEGALEVLKEEAAS